MLCRMSHHNFVVINYCEFVSSPVSSVQRTFSQMICGLSICIVAHFFNDFLLGLLSGAF